MKHVLSEIIWALRQPYLLVGALLLRLGAPLFRKARLSGQYPWVIGGHRGRMVADNSSELHQYVLTQGAPKIVWIANALLAKSLAAQGIPVLCRTSWKARLAIFRAPVVIYSHGEDDVDPYAILWRKVLGLRVHLNHSMNHLKTGQFYRKDIENYGALRMAFFRWTMVDFDLLPASSALEKKHFELSLPHRKDRIEVGGGAHIDKFLRMRSTPSDGSILWFPTFRDTRLEAAGLDSMIQQISQNQALRDWLLRENRTFYICGHINSSSQAKQVSDNSSPIKFCAPSTILERMAKAEVFISDYSGLTIDWLALQRPAIFFPFDLESYQQTRRFYIPYENFHYGPLAKTAEELVQTLTLGTWRDQGPWADRRELYYNSMFPCKEPEYAARTLQTIFCKLQATYA